MKIVVVANQKGGVGKTTTTVSLAAGLAKKGYRLLLLDLDPQANASSHLGIEGDKLSFYECLINAKNPAQCLQDTAIEGLQMIPSHMDLSGVEIHLARVDNYAEKIQQVFSNHNEFFQQFDYILVDTPPSLGILMTSSLAIADQVIIPLQCEWFGLEGLSKIVYIIEQIKSSGVNANISIEGIIMTMFDNRTNLSKQVVSETKKYFPQQVYHQYIPRSIKIGEAPSHAKSIFDYAPNTTAAIAYQKLADEFIERRKQW